MFEYFLPHSVLLELAAVTVSSSKADFHTISWLPDPYRRFSVRIAHAVELGWDQLVEAKAWKSIWSLYVQQRIKVFMWDLMHSRFVMNKLRETRELAVSLECSIYLESTESYLHVVRDCKETSEIWAALIPQDRLLAFFSMPLQQWIQWNLDGKDMKVIYNDWGERMATCCWLFWKWRNNNNFSHYPLPLEVRWDMIRWHFDELDRMHLRPTSATSSTQRHAIRVAWTCPPLDMLKLNVDGASRGNLGMAGFGCVIRDNRGRWLAGAARALGVSSAYQAEIWGDVLGLRLDWEQGFQTMLMETDSSLLQQKLTAVSNDDLELDVLLFECQKLLHLDWSVELRRIYREANFTADGVANLVISRPIGFYPLPDPPPEIGDVLLADMEGVSRVRFVPMYPT